MARSVPEWQGRTDDTPVPDRVRLRVFEKYHGRCYLSGVKLYGGDWEIEHVIAIINGGKNQESNLAPVLKGAVHRNKTKADLKIKAKSYRIRKRNIGIKKKSKFPGSRDSKWKRKVTGEWVRR